MIRAAPLFALLCGAVQSVAAAACEPLLTVQAVSGTRSYDRAALMAFDAVELSTTTPWTEGPQQFTGVLLADLLQDAGVETGAITLTAVNEYTARLDVADARPDGDGRGPVLAYLLNGREMSVREKGPFWLIWPFDEVPAFRTEVIYASSIWQLESIRQIPAAD